MQNYIQHAELGSYAVNIEGIYKFCVHIHAVLSESLVNLVS